MQNYRLIRGRIVVKETTANPYVNVSHSGNSTHVHHGIRRSTTLRINADDGRSYHLGWPNDLIAERGDRVAWLVRSGTTVAYFNVSYGQRWRKPGPELWIPFVAPIIPWVGTAAFIGLMNAWSLAPKSQTANIFHYANAAARIGFAVAVVCWIYLWWQHRKDRAATSVAQRKLGLNFK